MTVIRFPHQRGATVAAAGYACPAFCQLPLEHPFIDGDAELNLPYREHQATFGAATATRIELLADDEDGMACTSWDGDPDLPDVFHQHRPPWTPWQAVQVSQDLSALTAHIALHRSREGTR